MSTHFSTSESNIFARFGVSDIGLMSFSTVSSGCFFDNGMTVAYFHSLSSTPSLSELIKIALTGEARRCEKYFKTHGGMLSGPVALLTLMFSVAASVSVTLVMNNGSSASKIG